MSQALPGAAKGAGGSWQTFGLLAPNAFVLNHLRWAKADELGNLLFQGPLPARNGP